jgi:hypothetical protein
MEPRSACGKPVHKVTWHAPVVCIQVVKPEAGNSARSRQGTSRAHEHQIPREAMRTAERESRSSEQVSERSGSCA